MFTRATQLVHALLEMYVQPGDRVLDATCGNGHDTAFLAAQCGASGRVLAIDVQESAVQATMRRIREAGLSDRVDLHQSSHDNEALLAAWDGPLRCAVFNLGYLPGSDKTVTTLPETTIRAHDLVSRMLEPGGAIVTTVYIGHPGGSEEADALLAWAQNLDGGQWSVARHEWINQDSSSPFILIIQRR